MTVVLQNSLLFDPFTRPALPGVTPLGDQDWLVADDAFAAQMALRDDFLENRRSDVVMLDIAARPAAQELLNLVLDTLKGTRKGPFVRRDGVSVPVDRGDPMATLGRLAQEDFCILQKQGSEHVLTAAVLCFPAGWTLSQKFMKPLVRIHHPVKSYDTSIARRVQRLFDGVKVGRPLLRCNALWYDDPTLHQPRRENDPKRTAAKQPAEYFRTERQVVLRLPETDAVVFSIHTWVVHASVAKAYQGLQKD